MYFTVRQQDNKLCKGKKNVIRCVSEVVVTVE